MGVADGWVRSGADLIPGMAERRSSWLPYANCMYVSCFVLELHTWSTYKQRYKFASAVLHFPLPLTCSITRTQGRAPFPLLHLVLL